MVKRILILLMLFMPSLLWAQNYTALNGPFIGTPTKIISAGANLLGLVQGNGVMKSTNGGLNWTASNTGLTNKNLEDITKDALTGKLYAVAYGQLFTSTDNGANWTLTANSGFITARFIRKSTSFVFIVGYNSLIYRSSNDGVTWTQVNSFTGDPRDFELNSLGYLYIATSGDGIFRSTNNGLNVDQLDSGEGLTDVSIFSLVINGVNIYATSGSGPFKSTNNGDSWASVKNNITDLGFGWESYIEKDPSGNIYLFNGNLVWKTITGGTTWTSFASPIGTNGGNLRGPYFESATTFYVGIDNKLLYKTVDGGVSWIPLANNGIITTYGNDMIISDNGRLLYTVGYPNGFYMSIDDGATWDFLGSGQTNRQVRGFLKSGATIYGHGNGIIKTTDNGSNWTEQNAGTYYFENLATNDGVNMYSFNSYHNGTAWVWRVLKSINSGATWVGQDVSGMPNSQCSYVPEQDDVIITNGGNLFVRIYEYCTTNQHAVYKIDPTTGVATQVVSLPTTNNIEDIEFFNGKLYVFTNNSKLYTSNDGGQTWASKNTTTSFGRLKIISDNTFFILNSSVFLSTDGGDNWVNTGSPGSTNKWNRFALVSSANYSYISQDQNVMFRSATPIIPPAAPTSLSAFYSDQNSIGLIFTDNSSNEDYFVIEMAEGASTQFDSVANTTRPPTWARNRGVVAVSRTAEGLTFSANTTYRFRVRASGSGGKSTPSNEITASTTQDCLNTSNVPLNRSWTATTLNISGVGVMTKLNQTIAGSGGIYSLQDLPIGASVGLSPQPPDPFGVGFEENCGIVSNYSTFGYIANGNGTWDVATGKFTFPWMTHPQYPLRSETTVYTLNASDPVPADPVSLAATVFLPGTILLNWASGNFTLAFELERSLTSGSGFAKIGDVTFPKVSYKDLDPALVPGTTYFYRVRAKNATGNSGYTAEASVIPRSNYLFLPIDNLPSQTFFRTGGGGAWGDVDGDGINDLFLPVTQDSLGNVIPPVVFKSLGNGQFTKLAIPELANESITTRSVKIIDVNNDGLSDLFLTRSGGNDLLLTKNADGTYTKKLFTEYTQGGLPGGNWVDYDNDGYIDLLANTSLGAGSASDKYLFRNVGDGTFSRITDGELVTDFGATRDTQWADYDNDGDQDVIVLNVGTNPGVQSNTRLYKNNGDGTFTRVLGSVFETILSLDRTASWGDYDNDGDMDIFIGSQTTSINPQFINRLYKNNGDGTFSEFVGSVVAEGGLGTFGSAWADVDNDGDLDLFAMGFTSVLYYNNGNGTFTKYTTPELFNAPNLSKLYGPAMEDVDGDGFLDFHNGGFANPDIPNIIYKNTTLANSSRRWLKIKLTGTVSNRMGVGARAYVKTGVKTQIRELQSHSAHATQSSPTLHFGVGSAATIDEVRIVWPSGIEQFLYNVNPNQTITVVEDGDAPLITALSPVDDSDVIPGLNQLAVTFNEVPFAVASLKLRLYRNGNATPIATVDATSGTKSGNTYTYSIPAVNTVGSYYVQIDPFAFDDQWGNSHGGISDVTTWSFNIIDVTPPALTFTEVTSFEKGSGSATFTVGVTDAGGAASAKMHYKKIGSSQPFIETANTPVVTGQTAFTVQESWFDDMGMEYYFTALDNTGNMGRLPAGTATFHSYLKLTGAQAPTLPNLSFGGEVSNYRIFSIPYILANNSVSTLFNSVGAQDKNKWRLLSYKANPEAWIDFPSTIERGKGYFVNIVDAVEIALGDATAPTNNQNSPFTISLAQGFNLIGNPYTFNVKWSDVVTANPTAVLDDPLFFNGSYTTLTQIDKFQGAFVFAEAAVTISIPVVNAAGGRVGGRTLYTARLGEPDWELPFTLTQDSYENKLGAIGMHIDASVSSKDKYDRVTAPRMFDYLELNFEHPEYLGGRNFSKEMVTTAEEHVWEFDIASNLKGVATLGWDNLSLGDGTKELYLFDIARQQFVDMREMNSHSFSPRVSNQFKVYFGEDVKSKIKPTSILLGDAYPNPSSGAVTIPFTLPAKEPQYGVRLEVYDNMGRKVKTLIDKTLVPDFYSVQWNANNSELKSGLYTYRLIVTDKTGIDIQAGKLVLKK